MAIADRMLGLSILLLSGGIYVYYTLWVIVTVMGVFTCFKKRKCSNSFKKAFC